MKKIVSMILIFLIIFSITGCSPKRKMITHYLLKKLLSFLRKEIIYHGKILKNIKAKKSVLDYIFWNMKSMINTILL